MDGHWDNIYEECQLDKLGWYEESPELCLDLISQCDIAKDGLILDVGCGASSLIDCLIEAGYGNIIGTDISEVALEKLKERLGTENASQVKWIVDDISNPTQIQKLNDISIWHDRAVLHFLLEKQQIETYFKTLKKVVKKGGYVIIAAFSLEGAKKCAGLDLMNYDQDILSSHLGEDFKLIRFFNHTYHTPSGKPRPYIYTLFQRKT